MSARRVYDEGFDAFSEGENLTDCPYPEESNPRDYDDWVDGWCAACNIDNSKS
jgi:ribosome modulation factor